MLKFTTKSTIAVCSAYWALSTSQFSQFPDAWAAFGIGLGTAVVWDAIGALVKIVQRKEVLAAHLHRGQCPRCKAMQTMEVTSTENDLGSDGFRTIKTRIRCTSCFSAYEINDTGGGPIVTPLKN